MKTIYTHHPILRKMLEHNSRSMYTWMNILLLLKKRKRIYLKTFKLPIVLTFWFPITSGFFGGGRRNIFPSTKLCMFFRVSLVHLTFPHDLNYPWKMQFPWHCCPLWAPSESQSFLSGLVSHASGFPFLPVWGYHNLMSHQHLKLSMFQTKFILPSKCSRLIFLPVSQTVNNSVFIFSVLDIWVVSSFLVSVFACI